MKKADFKNGMKVLYKQGRKEKRIFIDGSFCTRSGDGWVLIDDFDDNLNHKGNSAFDIIEIFDRPSGHNVLSDSGDSIWERSNQELVPELTVQEICDKLGYEIKIKK